VVLVGSDVDRHLFAARLVDGIVGIADALSVYVSASCSALGMSKWVFRRDRLRQAWASTAMQPAAAGFLRQNEKLYLVDVTGAEGAQTGNGHGYFPSSPWGSSDVLMSLMYGLTPSDRGLVRRDQQPVWTFPGDYVERLRRSILTTDTVAPVPGPTE
jgi:hypothetical protein